MLLAFWVAKLNKFEFIHIKNLFKIIHITNLFKFIHIKNLFQLIKELAKSKWSFAGTTGLFKTRCICSKNTP